MQLRAWLAVRAMARERPTVVKGPFDIAIVFCKPLKKHLDVNVVAVQIMKMNYIRLNLIKSSKKAFCSSLTMKPSLAVQASLKHVELYFYIRGELHFVRLFCLAATTPEHIGFFAGSQKLSVLLHHNAAGRAVRHGVYVGIDRHYRLFLHTILSTTPV